MCLLEKTISESQIKADKEASEFAAQNRPLRMEEMAVYDGTLIAFSSQKSNVIRMIDGPRLHGSIFMIYMEPLVFAAIHGTHNINVRNCDEDEWFNFQKACARYKALRKTIMETEAEKK